MPTLYRRVRTMIGAAWDAARAADDELSKAETSASFPGWTLMSEQAVSGGTGKQEIAPTGQDTLRMYERNVWVFAILSAKATYIAGMPWHLMRRRKGTDEVITEHEAIDLLEYPAPKRTWRNICALMVAQLDLTGRCALEKGRDGESGPVTQLHPLFSQYLRVLIDGKQGISGFAYRPNDVETILPPEDVAYFHDMSPLSEFTGVGAMRPAWLTAQLDMHSRQWNANFFARGAHPDGVVMAEKQIAPAIRERIEADFMNRHKGTRKGRGVEILEQGMKFQEVGVTHRELQFEKLMHMDREELHAAFRVPPVISGLTDQTNYATASVQERLFRFNTGIPLLGMILETLNLDVLPDLDPTGELYYAVDFAALSTDEERTARMTYVTQGLAAKVLDENEGREHLGYKPREQADEAQDEEDDRGRVYALHTVHTI